MGRLIGNNIGEVLKVVVEEDELALGGFMRTHVNIDVSKPFLRGKKINLDFAKPFWIHFSYEWLPNFSYNYGRLGHGHKDCMHELHILKTSDGGETKRFHMVNS